MIPPCSANVLSDLCDAYWTLEKEETPFHAILAGAETQSVKVFCEAQSDHDRRAARAKALQAALEKIDTSALHFKDQVTAKLLAYELEMIIKLHELDAHMRPSLLPLGPDFNMVYFANTTSLENIEQAERYLQRLKTFPDFIEDLKTNLRTGIQKGYRYPAHIITAAIKVAAVNIKEDATQSAWYKPFLRSSIRSNPRLQAVAQEVKDFIEIKLYPSLKSYEDFLHQDLQKHTRQSISAIEDQNGRDLYQYLVKRFTSLSIDPNEIHHIGLSEVRRLNDELAKVADRAGTKNIKDYRTSLTSNPDYIAASANHLQQEVESLCKRIDGKIPTYFSNLPRITYGVNLVPEEMSDTMPPAYAQPSTSDGNSPGIFWINSNTQKVPRYILASLALHEAWPGHLMHIAMMQEQTDVPTFRRFGAVKYTSCIEGWALYCETLGIEMGLYEDPASDFGRLEMELWRAARLVVDTGIHWHGWSRDQAIKYMTSELSLSSSTIESEVDRYIALPAQALGYQIGNLKICELRRKAEHVMGDHFSIKSFHNTITSAGPVTLDILDSIVSQWISQSMAAIPLSA